MAVALVTGAAMGIGEAVARRLAADDDDLVLLDIAEEPLLDLTADLAKAGARVEPVVGSVADPDVCLKAASKAIDSEMDAGQHRTANRVLQLARCVFTWVVERDLIPTDPTTGIGTPAKETSRDRVLSDDELVTVFKAAGDLGWPFGPFVQLLALTAQRRSEQANARWQNLDLGKALWRITAEFTKSNREHELPLPSEAVAIFKSLPRIEGENRVFPATRSRSNDGIRRSISGFGKVKLRLDGLTGIPDWKFHDLRRTAASGIARLGVPPHILAAVLNHDQRSVQGVTAIYNRSRYAKEKREALELWNQHVAALVAGSGEKVVPLRA